MECFKTWAKESGITTFGTLIKETTTSGNGLFSSQAINKDTEVVQIPSQLVLSSKRVLQDNEEFSDLVYNYYMKRHNITLLEAKKMAVDQDRTILCLFLIFYRFFNENAKWKPYMDILPTLEFFQKTHVLFNPGIVKGTCLENSVRSKISSLERELEEINQYWPTRIELDMYLWADCTVWSRVVGITETEIVLVPYFDLANHSLNESNIRWELTDDDGLALVTTKDIKTQDEELTLFYGSKPNQELLFLHGFCIQDNPETSRITIPLMPFLDLSDPVDISKIQWLKSVGAKPILTLMGSSTSNLDPLVADGWTVDSVAALYLIALTEDEGLCFSSMDLQIHGRPVKDLNELYACAKGLDLFPLIQLRAVVLLTNALEYHLNMNIEHEVDQDGSGPLLAHTSIYRIEERTIMQRAQTQLGHLQDELLKNKVVLSYLQEQQ
jgi:hypothetical protein